MKGILSTKARLWGNLIEKPSFFSKYCCCSFAKLYPTPCVYGIAQVRILEWLPFPSPGIFPDQELNPHLLCWQADSLSLSYQGSLANIFQEKEE